MGAAAVVVYLGLGSNRGDRWEHLQQSLIELARRGVVARLASSVFQGPYIGPGLRQGEFLNAVVQAQTQLSPLQLLEATQDVERARGRQQLSHMQPRTLDVDILLYGGCVVRHPRLVVPHRRLWERRFVVEPLVEVLDATHPLRPRLRAALQGLRGQRLTLHPAALATGEALASLST